MHIQRRGAPLFALLLLLGAVAPASAAMGLQEAFPNLPYFSTPTGLVDAMDGTGRLFVTEKNGYIHVFQNNRYVTTSTLFLDVSDSTANNFESGMLGLAFHPNYAQNGYFYITYINKAKLPLKWVLARYHVSANPNVADPNSELRLIEIPQIETYHKGGHVVFGPDGYLYVTTGEDGQIYDAQSRASLKGKMLRIDVDHPAGGKNYGIPDGNPYKGNALGYREEIWAYGLRNPWKFSFGPDGQIWEGDVGLDTFEEINIIKKGRNYGWPRMEGTQCAYPTPCDTTGLNIQLPLFQYLHESQYGAAIIGGTVYLGAQHPELLGRYIYADHPTDHIWALYWDGVHPPTNTELFHYPPEAFYRITSICQDRDRELFFTGYYGGIFQLVGTASDVGNGAPRVPSAILSANPNPFVRETKFRLSAQGPATIHVYDVSGRLVQRLESTGSGERDVAWDGRDLAGHRATSGVYFARLIVNGQTAGTRRIVLLK
ncbi:MAG TPA: PQQ-dependent sugar dehydrogenase [Candidatus Krumholzibacteria bacterium]|nr:PQQ-dependent sugar dehydrogenase [Candidatus Krumholzibacteria bacterium]